jgi:hypothetical protein
MGRFCRNSAALLGADCLFSQPFCQAKSLEVGWNGSGKAAQTAVRVDLGRIPVQK